MITRGGVAIGLVGVWAALLVAILVAAARGLFHTDPREQALDDAMEAKTLAEYTARVLEHAGQQNSKPAGTPAKEWPTGLTNLKGE